MEIKKASMIARDLMNYHRLESWSFEMRPMKSWFGFCFAKKQIIALSSLLTELNEESEVINTILHEIAHALAPRKAWHNHQWRTIAKAIGCTGRRCYGADVIKPPKAYMGTCPKCARIIEAHRRRRISCGRCDPKFNVSLLFQWRTK